VRPQWYVCSNVSKKSTSSEGVNTTSRGRASCLEEEARSRNLSAGARFRQDVDAARARQEQNRSVWKASELPEEGLSVLSRALPASGAGAVSFFADWKFQLSTIPVVHLLKTIL